MTTVDFPLLPGKAPVRFRFTIPNVRALELAAGCGIDLLRMRGQQIHALVLLVCYGLKWSDKKMTEDKAADYIEAYRDSGGDIVELSKAVVKALNSSGVYGPAEVEGADEDGEGADPTPESDAPTVM
jgi:hypothetical protein